MIHGNARSQNLHDELRQRLERQHIVQRAEHHDDDRTEQNALKLAVNVGKDQRRKQERQKNRKSPKAWDGYLVHPAAVLRHVDRADLVGKRFDERGG